MLEKNLAELTKKNPKFYLGETFEIDYQKEDAKALVDYQKTWVNKEINIVVLGSFQKDLLELVKDFKGFVFVYDDNKARIHNEMSKYDMTELINLRFVFFIHDIELLRKTLMQIIHPESDIYVIADNITKAIIEMTVKDCIENNKWAYQCMLNQYRKFNANTIKNIDNFINYRRIHNFCELLAPQLIKRKPALIIGSGPSLKENIEQLKKYKNAFSIMSCFSACEYLHENDIIPDYVFFADDFIGEKQLNKWLDDKISDNLIFVSTSIPDIVSVKAKNTYILNPVNNFLGVGLLEQLNEPSYMMVKGSAIGIAVNCAAGMGFKEICLLGVDLCYKNNELYGIENEETEKFNNNINNYFEDENYYHRHKYSNNNRVEIETVDGNIAVTNLPYKSYKEHIEEIILASPMIKYLNFSFGAKIKGCQDIELVKYLETLVDEAGNNERTIYEYMEQCLSELYSIKDNRQACIDLLNKNNLLKGLLFEYYYDDNFEQDKFEKELLPLLNKTKMMNGFISQDDKIQQDN